MRKAKIFVSGEEAGILTEIEKGKKYEFEYLSDYIGQSVSLTIPVSKRIFSFDSFPPFFDGLLPEGWQLENLLKQKKLDRTDNFSQLVIVGKDMIGNITVEEIR